MLGKKNVKRKKMQSNNTLINHKILNIIQYRIYIIRKKNFTQYLKANGRGKGGGNPRKQN